MKKYLLTIFLLIISLSLGARAIEYNSNALSQKLGSYDGFSNYKLVVLFDNEVSTTSLFFKSNLIKKTITELIGDTKIVTIFENDNKSIKTYKNNLLIQSDDGNITSFYNYQDSTLISKIVKENNVIIEFNRYFYSKNKLIAILRSLNNDEIIYTLFNIGDNSSISISKNDKFKQITVYNSLLSSQTFVGENQILSSNVERLVDNSLIISTKKNELNSKEYYNNDGILYRSEIINEDGIILSKNTYEYNELRELYKKTEIEKVNYKKVDNKNIFNTKTSVTYYIKGIIDKIEIYMDDILISSSIYNSLNQRVETLYKDNRVYCIITYSQDDIKILDIIYQ